MTCKFGMRREVFDVAIVGGSPAGIAAALVCARAGYKVALTEYHPHLGGMCASGLGKSDISQRELIGGIFNEFVERVRNYYAQKFGESSLDFSLCQDGYYYEPSVAERVFNEMLATESEQIHIFLEYQLESVEVVAGRVSSAMLRARRTGGELTLKAEVFIDATYEGDLYALAGADYRLGRESHEDYGEPHAGVVYYDYELGTFLDGTTGEGDDRLPAYTYRLCLTTDPQNSYILESAPDQYDPRLYVPYLDDLHAGRLTAPKRLVEGWGFYQAHFDTLLRALSVTELPNRKVDANINPRPLAFPFPEENLGYVQGSWEIREQICRKHRNITLGLLYFLQNHPAVPPEQRLMARQYNLPLDEFTDNDHFPFQLYVREARRLCGRYTLTEHDVTRLGGKEHTGLHFDAIAVGEFPIDSFPTQRRKPTDDRVLEGYLGMLDEITRPYQIPYRIMLPTSIDRLLVPVAASTTHVAYSSIRMEPTWMALGQAAGVAACLVLEHRCKCHQVDIAELQRLLRDQGQVLEPFPQIDSKINDARAAAVAPVATFGQLRLKRP